MNLNEEQQLACNAPLGYNLVIASAGTGKTSTIVGRIAHLLRQDIKPEQILLLTFTNKASSEMITRVAKMFGEGIANKIESGTFHSVAYRYLKAHRSVSLKQPRELMILFKSIYDRHLFDKDKMPYSYQYLYQSYGLFHNSVINGSYRDWLERKNEDQLRFVDIYEDIFDEFNRLKMEYGYVDYNDLLILYREELKQLASINSTPYIEVLCDEYQDTNPLQDSLIRAINPKSLFCVGDYDQSIYAFNGADISIITNFTKNYPNSRVFSLSKNYRSTEHILNLANKVIANNPRIYPKTLKIVKKGGSHAPALLKYNDLFAQYSGIAKQIQKLHKYSGIPYESMAIIYRNNSSADGIQAALRTLNINSKRKGSTSFFDSKEIEFLLCLCSILANKNDMMSYIHIISHAKGIGNSIAKDIFEALMLVGAGDCKIGLLSPNKNIECYFSRANNTGIGLFDEFFRKEERSRFDSVLHDDFKSHPILEHPKITQEAAIFLNDFFIVYKQNHDEQNPTILLENLCNCSLYKNYLNYLSRDRAKGKDGKLDLTLLESVKKRIDSKIAILQDISRNYKDLLGFLNAMVLGSNELAEGSGVNLLSVHASKGLEFSCVFLVDLMDGRFPNRKLASKSGSIEEERRLFYVACTRAKELLYLSFAMQNTREQKEYIPSIFLFEADLLKEEDYDVTKICDMKRT
ncbi:ATP-dependent helicase [Helicobacter muridarum]|uniref:DNA 3'-5' helicase n=1 Tax=Helicobacter muridarum TaxID=216 RepID=A0A377PUN8_9HELI|nr:ATP-dependent helicase [Helicobacter muridarum]TLE01606.1 ATP-dependent helicase [Helicobacter muridarum]STQ86220.1 ATP-dependent DNA helicase [Helicobacter muridarum]